jgi:S-adenosylmethionine hydrolase
MSLIVLTTDFGPGSTYVAEMKGVLLSANPEARIIDASHALPAHDVQAAELYLRTVAWAFPLGAVHLVVIDPGVGSARRGIALVSRGMYFVGPDNGVLGRMAAVKDARCVHLDRDEFFRQPVAPTFHGRDIFAPIAAELAAGLPLEAVGSPITDWLPSRLPRAVQEHQRWAGAILGADRFGNLTTNLPARLLREFSVVRTNLGEVPVHESYSDVPVGQLLALAGSDGYVELACREGSALELLSTQGPVFLESAE